MNYVFEIVYPTKTQFAVLWREQKSDRIISNKSCGSSPWGILWLGFFLLYHPRLIQKTVIFKFFNNKSFWVSVISPDDRQIKPVIPFPNKGCRLTEILYEERNMPIGRMSLVSATEPVAILRLFFQLYRLTFHRYGWFGATLSAIIIMALYLSVISRKIIPEKQWQKENTKPTIPLSLIHI